MKTTTNLFSSLVYDDKKFLTSFIYPVVQKLNTNTGVEALPKKAVKEITVFLVDDDLLYLTAMEYFLLEEIPSLKIKTFQTGESSLLEMDQKPDIVILDYYLDSENPSAENGIKILKKIKYLNSNIKVVILSAQDNIKVAMNSIKHGAYDYVPKSETAFIKIKNILMNVTGNIDIIDRVKKHMKVFKIINFVILIMLILFFLLGH